MAIRMRRTSLRKPSFREQVEQSNASDRYYAAMFGKEPQAQTALAAKRVVVNRSDASQLEAAVQTEVESVLASHPSVIFAIRQNTGAAKMTGRDGKEYPIWFYRWIRRSEPMTVTDFWGFMRVGYSLVPFAIECKRRNWKPSLNDAHENHQRAFIAQIESLGGRGGFVTSAEQALAILK